MLVHLTFDAEPDEVALARAVTVGCRADVISRVLSRHPLDHQAQVAQDYPRVHVVSQWDALREREKIDYYQ